MKLTFILLFAAALGAPATRADETPKPNVLIILTDDQRADTIGALNNKHIRTPNLDRLAQRSLVFPNAYCYGAHTGAVCIASRNQLMTGRTWHRWAPARHCPSDGLTFPKMMKAAGYETFYREKSGRGNHPAILKQFDHCKDIHNVRALMSGRACKPFVDDALDFLTNTRDSSKPFFMYLGVSGPHDPRFAENRFRKQYELEKIPLPANYKPLHHWDIGDMTIRDEKLEAWPRSAEATRSHLLDYYALVTAMDHDIGRLLDHLDRSGLAKNTIILFTSDHGLAIGSHGLFGKQNLYEHSMRVPFLITGPGIVSGESNALIYLHDILPTIASYAGGTVDERIDGRNLRPVIERKSDGVRDAISLAYKDSQRSVRDARWKLMVFLQINRHQLFDLRNDPHETTNLAEHPEHRAEVNRLTPLLQREQERAGDDQTLTVAKPRPATFKVPAGVTPTNRNKVGGAVE